MTSAQYDAAILAHSIVPLPTLVPEVDAPNPDATALQSSRHKDQVAYSINANKKVAIIKEGIIAYRGKLILALNQESLGALQSTYGQTNLSTLSTNLIWTYLDNQYLHFTFATHQAIKVSLAAKLLDSNLLTNHIANFRKYQRLLSEQNMGSNPIQQFQEFNNTLDTCPSIAQFATEFKREHININTWTMDLFLNYFIDRAKTLTSNDHNTMTTAASLQATINAAVNAALASHPATLAAGAAAKPPRTAPSNRSTLTAPSNRSVAAPKPLRTQRPPPKPPSISYCWYHGTCGHSGSICDKMEDLPFTDAHRSATSAITINGQKGSEYSFNK